LFVPKNPKKQRLIALGSVLAILVSLLVALWQMGYAQDLFPSAAGSCRYNCNLDKTKCVAECKEFYSYPNVPENKAECLKECGYIRTANERAACVRSCNGNCNNSTCRRGGKMLSNCKKGCNEEMRACLKVCP